MDRDYLVRLIDALIESRQAIKQEITKLKDKVETHHATCNGVKTGSAVVAAIGGGLALFTGGLSLLLTAGAAATASTVTSLVDIYKSDDYINEVQRIAERESDPAEKLANALEQLEQMSDKLSEQRNISFEDAFLINLRKHVKDSSSDTMIKVMKVMRDIRRKITKKMRKQIAKSTGKQIGKVAGKAVSKFVISTAVDVYDCIEGWSSCHPTVEQMNTLMSDIDGGINDLLNLRKLLLAM